MTLTTDTLLESIKRRAMLPTNNNTFSDADLLAFANEELAIGIVPSILMYHEEYFVYSEDIALEDNVSRYQIPYRAIGGKLRDVFYKDSNDNLYKMTRIAPENKTEYQSTSVNSHLFAYYIEGNDIVIVPSVGDSATGSLQVSYYLRPNELVDEDRVAVIDSISVGASTTVFTLEAFPTGMSTSTPLDILQAKPGHKTRAFDLTPTAVSEVGLTITFSNTDLPDNIVEGDHITFAGECKIPQIPTDLHVVLAQRVAARCLEALGDSNGLQAANTKLGEMEVKTSTLVDNRVDGSPMKVTNPGGLLRQSKIGKKWW